MKRKGILILMMLAICLTAFCQTTSSPEPNGNSVGNTVLNILIGVGFLWMVGHMIYELYIKKNPFTPITIQEMQEKRSEFGQSADMTEAEQQQCLSLMEQEFERWTPIPDDPQERRIITSKAQLNHAADTIAQIKEIKPTSPEIIDAVNEYIKVSADCRKRVFTGSKFILVLLALFTLFIFYIAGWRGVPFFLISGVVYYLASLTPNFMLYRKELKGSRGSGALSWVFGILAGMILGAKTVRTTTLWSDGSKTVDDDYSQHQAAWGISIFVTIVIVCFLVLWAAISYLRNYVLYR